MKKSIIFFMAATLGLLSTVSCGGHGSYQKEAIPGAKEFLTNEHWNQGKAEYQSYRLSGLSWYGKPRSSDDSIMIAVKEPWDTKRNVKVAAEEMDSAVVKFSMFEMFQTGTYPYSFKADIFFNVNNGEVVKYAMGSHDGCGNHFFQYDKKGKNGVFSWHSYWDGHGLIEVKKSVDDFDTFIDALPFYLRFRLSEGSYTAKAVQPLIANRPIDLSDPKKHLADQKDTEARGVPSIVEIQVTNTPGQTLNGKKVVKSVVVHGSATDTFYFEEAFPHNLVKWEGNATRELRLSQFFAYWVPDNRGQEAGYLYK